MVGKVLGGGLSDVVGTRRAAFPGLCWGVVLLAAGGCSAGDDHAVSATAAALTAENSKGYGGASGSGGAAGGSGGGSCSAAPDPVLGTFVIYAREAALLGESDAIVGGDVGVQKAGSCAESEGFALLVQPHVTVDEAFGVFADSIRLKSGSVVGSVHTNRLDDHALRHGRVTRLPVMPALPTVPAIRPGTTTITVPKGQTRTLNAGAFGTVTVRGTLRLSGGLYQFGSLALASDARLEVTAAAEVRVKGTVDTDSGSFMGPAPSSGLHARDLQLLVTGTEKDGNSVELGHASSTRALIVAPAGRVQVEESATVQGAIAADRVLLLPHVTVRLEDRLPGTSPPPPPTPVDDGNPCTVDACDSAGRATHTPVPAGTACSDGNACNGAETCDGSGTCRPGAPPTVDDGNPCTADSCNPGTGVHHVAVADGTACTDGNACTSADACHGGVCAGGAPVTCPAADQCHDPGVCDPASGDCSNPPKVNGSACNDANACTRVDSCQQGTCTGSDPIVCFPLDACHVAEACDPATGLCPNRPIADGTPCSDGNPCTQLDACQGGACVGANPIICVAVDQCHLAGVCDSTSGKCSDPVKPDNTLCSDGNACNGVESCAAGVCTPGTAPPLDDHNPCTADSCDPIAGVHHQPSPAGTSCSDGDPCNGNEACDGHGLCVSQGSGGGSSGGGTSGSGGGVLSRTPWQMNDGEGLVSFGFTSATYGDVAEYAFATIPPSVAPGWQPAPDGAAIGYSVPSTLCGHLDCRAGAQFTYFQTFVNVPTDVAVTTFTIAFAGVDDGTRTTIFNSAFPAGVVVPGSYVFLGGSGTADLSALVRAGEVNRVVVTHTDDCCSASFLSSATVVLNGTPVPPSAPPVIDDGNPCTTDACDPVHGISHTPVADGTACGDRNVCNGDETCQGGLCAAGSPPAVDDGNPCTADACDPTSGATHVAIPAGASCSDGNVCNGAEACDGAGTCAAGTALLVDDGNPCTIDSCDPIVGVRHDPAAAGTSCSDGSACSGRRTCDGQGACVPQVALFNTGVDANGVPLAGGSVDPHYRLIQSADATLTGPDAIVTSQIAEGYWVPQSATSKWIAPSANQSYPGASPCNASGTYVYRTTFDLTGYDPATAKITGQWGADNTATAMRLNGVSLGLAVPAPAYTPLTPFTITSGFLSGTNTLDFEIVDFGCPSGLRVELAVSAAVVGASGSGQAPGIDDGNPCTVDACDPGTGVTHIPVANGTVCDDKNACTETSLCQDGACIGSNPIVCTAGACHQAGACDPVRGCTGNAPAPDGTHCDDGTVCTQNDQCVSGACIGETPSSAPPTSPNPGPPARLCPFSSPIGVAANRNRLLVSEYGGPRVFYIDDHGNQSVFATLPVGLNGAIEKYMATSPGLGGFPPNDVYISVGSDIFRIDAEGNVTLFTTLPGNGTTHVGIGFDKTGLFSFDMIVAGGMSGQIWRVNHLGVGTKIASLGRIVEGPDVAPASFAPYGGHILVASEDASAVFAISPGPDYHVATVISWPSAESVHVVPDHPCSYGHTGAAFFSAIYPSAVFKYPTGDFIGLGGQVLVTSEGGGIGIMKSVNGAIVATQFQPNVGQHEGSAFVDCDVPSTCDICSGVTCDPPDACHEPGVCDPLSAICNYVPRPAGASCADANACNGVETCDGAGACASSTPPVVDDGNVCTTDACDAALGVTHTPVADGTACALGHQCLAGQCLLNCLPPPPGIVGWWTADGDALDISGLHDGLISGPARFTRGEVADGFLFDGTNHVRVLDDPALKPTAVTIDGWIRPNFTGRPAQPFDVDVILAKGDATSRGYMLFVAMADIPGWFQGPSTGVPLGTPVVYFNVGGTPNQLFGNRAIPNDGVFHFVAATFDGGTIRLFLDGAEVASRTVGGTLQNSDGDGFIGFIPEQTLGSGLPARSSQAAIDEVQLFDRALSPADLSAIFEAGSSGTCKPTGPPPNHAPVVSCGPDRRQPFSENFVTIQCAVSDDGRPLPLSTFWEISGPGLLGPGDVTPGFDNITARLTAPGVYHFRLTATDSDLSTTDDVVVTLVPVIVDNPPTVAQAATVSPNPITATAANLSVLGADDGGESSLVYTWTVVGPAPVTFTTNDTNAAKNTTATFSAAGSYTFTATIVDALGQEAVSHVDAAVLPTLTSALATPAAATLDVTQTLSETAAALDQFAQPIGGAVTIHWAEVSGPGVATFTGSNQANTDVTFSAPGDYVIRADASDGVHAASVDVLITANPAPGGPPAVAIDAPAEGAAFAGPVEISGSVSGGQWTLSYRLGGDAVTGAPYVDLATGSGAVSHARFGTFDPTGLPSGTYALKLTAVTATGQTASTTRTIGVRRSGNLRPSIYSIAPTVATTGVRYAYVALASDPNADALTFSLAVAPAGMVIDPNSGIIGWTASAGQLGDAHVVVHVQDPGGLFDEQSYDVSVARGQAPPRITSIPPLVGTAGQTYAYDVTISDPDDSTFTFQITGPPGMVVDSAGHVRWPVPSGSSGLFPGALTVTDGTANVVQQSFVVAVAVPGDTTAPTVAITAPVAGGLTAPADVIGSANDDSLAGYTLELCRTWGGGDCMVVQRGTGPVVNGVLGHIDPNAVADGSWMLKLVAVDASGNQSTASVDLAVHAGIRKLGVLRLAFNEFTLQTKTAQFTLQRIYDSLDLSSTALGNGWQYRFDSGHFERGHDVATGWEVSLDTSGFIPTFVASPTVDHPLRFYLDDGRFFSFEALLECDGALSSVHQVRPSFVELTTTGATLTALDGSLTPISTENFDEIVIDDSVFEGDFSTPFEPGFYQIHTPQNEDIIFDIHTGHLVSFSDGTGFKLERDANGVRLNGADILRFDYGGDGKITRATDLLAHRAVQYQHDASGNLTTAVLPGGAIQTFVYADGAHLVGYSTTGVAPEEYQYDDKGRVILRIDAGGALTRTTYDDANRTITTSDAAGHTVVSEYSPDGNIYELTDPLGHKTTWEYVPGTSRQASRTNPLGATWHFQYDSHNRPVGQTDPLGHTRSTVYDPIFAYPATATDGEGRTFREVLDDRGRVTAHVLPDGTRPTTYSYPDEHTTVTTDFLGRSVTSIVDDRGRNVSEQTADGITTSVYDDTAHTVTINRPDGSRSVATVDGLDRITRLSTPVGTFQYTFGATTLPDKVVRPDGATVLYAKHGDGELAGVSIDGVPTQRVNYDGLGRVASVSENGKARAFQYDAAGRMTVETSPEGTVNYTYDDAGQLIHVTTSTGINRSFVYDLSGRMTALDNGAGQRYEIGYDRSDRITAVVDGNGRSFAAGYDANGVMNSVTYPGGLTTSWTYIPSDKSDDGSPPPLASQVDLDGVSWQYGHDVDERLVSVLDAAGGQTAITRTAGQTTVTDAAGRITSFVRSADQLTSLTSPAGRTQTFAYDGSGRLTNWTRFDGTAVTYAHTGRSTIASLPGGEVDEVLEDPTLGMVAHLGGPGGAVTEWKNSRGLVDLLQTSDGGSVSLSYTPDGHVAQVEATTPAGTIFTTAYAYDSDGKLSTLLDPDGGTTSYGRDGQGRIISIDRPNGVHTQLSYGGIDRPISVVHSKSGNVLAAHTFAYDTHGRVIAATTPDGSFAYQYDLIGRLAVEQTLSGGNVISQRSRSYDAVGNVSTLTDASGVTTFSYDADDRLVAAVGPSGTTHYAYNGRGALTQIDAAGGATAFVYDALDRLTAVTMPDGATVSYAYDSAGRLLARTDGQGTRHCLPLPATPRNTDDCAAYYSSGAAEQPKALAFGPFGTASAHGASKRYVLAGLLDNVVGLTDAGGAMTGSAAFDPFGAKVSVTGEPSDYGFTGERQDPITGLVFLRARWYDPRLGRFLTPDRFVASIKDPRTLHRYAYALSNPLNRRDTTGQFSLGELSISISISDTLDAIESTFKVCLKKKLEGELFRSLAKWAATKIAGAVLESFFAELKAIAGGGMVLEKVFQNRLADLLCRPKFDLADDLAFEVPLNPCGDKALKAQEPIGIYECAELIKGGFGIDILVEGVLPIELKVSKNTFKDLQLARYCRFGAAQGSHTTIYGFVEFPDKKDHEKWAKDCWGCWEGEGSGACTNPGKIGSIYLGFGAIKNGAKERTFVPSKSLLGCE